MQTTIILQSKGSRNIIGTYFLSNETEKHQGFNWYSQAKQIAARIANNYGLTTDTVVGVIAALSPNNKWERNLIDAENICRLYSVGGPASAADCKVCTYKANLRKAVQILMGEDIVETLSGPKVIEFYNCILGRPDVCIDGHAYSVWFGDRLTMKEVPSIGKKLRETIKQDYIGAAEYINIQPFELQAITWCTWRRIHEIG
ncbi:hypothetical protein [Cyanobium sp. A2C-AMD]|uniref:DUF7178 family protein n=1 Tax=Cyanobium sp. A2C-AMD TaxID=2823695 RepID=UPI0020CD65F7|nr:hypothetical protein [Cyanobium sp. A2C-AMD]MCP9876027.1 hypothetical protein [Cyanobium sp. A2C-AMD]